MVAYRAVKAIIACVRIVISEDAAATRTSVISAGIIVIALAALRALRLWRVGAAITRL